jgi:RecB family exonuclease
MLTIVRSPLPSLSSEPATLPPEVSRLLKRLQERPQRCQCIVPTGRRTRALLHNWLRTEERSASLLPGLHTIKSFAAQLLEYSPKQLPQISGPERLLRVARAWQEVMQRPPGSKLVRQLDRFIRDWQACNLPLPSKTAGDFELLVQHYCAGLQADHRSDYYASLRVLVQEIADPESWPNRLFLQRIDLVLVDGFHRLERLELELIAALALRCEVLAWLVGVPGQPSWNMLESVVERLREGATDPLVLDHVPEPTTPFTRLGRRLFSPEPMPSTRSQPLPGLYKLETANNALEVEAVAKRIKADYLDSQKTDRPLRLSDIAIVIPGPDYDPLIREIFPRAGLEFNLAGQALHVSTSRPARVLNAAVELAYGHWRHDLLYDFLNLPLVKRCLADVHRLHTLFEHRPRVRRQLDYPVWQGTWDRHLQKLRTRIDRWSKGELELPEQTILNRDEFVSKQRELAGSLERLTQSIQTILKPVAAITNLVDGATTLDELVKPCVELLCLLDIAQWLAPHQQAREKSEKQYGVAVPWVEYEKDQKAYYRLLSILKTLPAIPPHRLPRTSQGRVDAVRALQLALESETYQIKTADDAGVQLFELREIRGLRFRHLYVLGLVDGQIPQLPEEGILARRRRETPALDEQLKSREWELATVFSQLFETAEERLVLACPGLDAYQKNAPSRFLVAVEKQVALTPLEPANVTAGMHEATIELGRMARETDQETSRQADKENGLEDVAADLASWRLRHTRSGMDGRRIRVDAEPILQLLFHDGCVFSPSELETYAACPFRYFGARVLKLEERDPDRTRWYYGSLVHRVFQLFYTELRQRMEVGEGEPLPAIELVHRARLLELFEAEWEQLDDGSLPAELKNLFGCDQGVLHLFFEAIATIEKEHGNLLNEFVLRDGHGDAILLGTDDHNRQVLLTGKIDRVDVDRAERTRAIILDYKTGRSRSATERKVKIEDGRMLQLPLYAAALERVRAELKVVGGAYIHVSEKLADAKKAIAAAGELIPRGGRSTSVPFETEAARRLALQLVGEIRDGNFSLTPHSLDRRHSECTSYCEMKHACRNPDGYQAFERY